MGKIEEYQGMFEPLPPGIAAPALEAACAWKQDDITGAWETGCGNAFELTTGTPTENALNFCCYCGQPLREVRE